MSDVTRIIQDIDKLKPFPQVANKILSIAEDPNSSMQKVSELISYDQFLTANLLKICNSAYFGLPNEVESVHQAVVYLGLDQVIDLVLLNGGVINMTSKQEGYDLEQGDLWKYSALSAIMAKELAELKGNKNNHLIFTAALLKDIGKVILSQYIPEHNNRITRLVASSGLSFREAEKEALGIDHAELGSIVAKKWKFSQKLVDIIRNHHLSEKEENVDFATAIVHLADSLCMMMGIGVGSDGLAYRFHKKVIKQLDFNQEQIDGLIAGFGDKLQQVEAMIE